MKTRLRVSPDSSSPAQDNPSSNLYELKHIRLDKFSNLTSNSSSHSPQADLSTPITSLNIQYPGTTPSYYQPLNPVNLHSATLETDFDPDESDPDLTSEETEKLHSLVLKYKRDWKRIAVQFEKITSKKHTPLSLRLKYNQQETNKPDFHKFTAEDDRKLKRCVKTYGLNWDIISEYFPGRCQLSLRNRYYSKIKGRKTKALNLTRHKDPPLFKKPSVIEKSSQMRDLPLSSLIDEIKLGECEGWISLVTRSNLKIECD